MGWDDDDIRDETERKELIDKNDDGYCKPNKERWDKIEEEENQDMEDITTAIPTTGEVRTKEKQKVGKK